MQILIVLAVATGAASGLPSSCQRRSFIDVNAPVVVSSFQDFCFVHHFPMREGALSLWLWRSQWQPRASHLLFSTATGYEGFAPQLYMDEPQVRGKLLCPTLCVLLFAGTRGHCCHLSRSFPLHSISSPHTPAALASCCCNMVSDCNGRPRHVYGQHGCLHRWATFDCTELHIQQ